MPAKLYETMSEKIARFSMPEPNSGCHLWLGCDNGGGYGIVWTGVRQTYAHRLSFETFKGPIPSGMVVCHKCDNRACVNPDHLFLGTQQDNVADRDRKGRTARGHPSHSKLTEAEVLAIRSDTRRQYDIADAFGVNQSIVSKIKARELWAHVDGPASVYRMKRRRPQRAPNPALARQAKIIEAKKKLQELEASQ